MTTRSSTTGRADQTSFTGKRDSAVRVNRVGATGDTEDWRQNWRDTLVDFYSDVGDIKLVIEDAGIDFSRVRRGQQSAKELWHDALVEANRQDKLERLRERVVKDYSTLGDKLPLSIVRDRPIERDTFSTPRAPDLVPRERAESASFRGPANQLKILDELQSTVRAVQVLADRYREVVGRRSVASKFRMLTQRLSETPAQGDEYRLFRQKEAAAVFDGMNDPLHEYVASQLPHIKAKIKKHGPRLKKAAEAVSDLRAMVVDGKQADDVANEIETFWTEVQHELHNKITCQCAELGRLVEQMKGN